LGQYKVRLAVDADHRHAGPVQRGLAYRGLLIDRAKAIMTTWILG
jgi:hypothetical protein